MVAVARVVAVPLVLEGVPVVAPSEAEEGAQVAEAEADAVEQRLRRCSSHLRQ